MFVLFLFHKWKGRVVLKGGGELPSSRGPCDPPLNAPKVCRPVCRCSGLCSEELRSNTAFSRSAEMCNTFFATFRKFFRGELPSSFPKTERKLAEFYSATLWLIPGWLDLGRQ